MRVWLYARLSNDDDAEMDSLQNQQEICRAYAQAHGHQIAGQSVDDNISGMTFSRRGLEQLTSAAEAGRIDAVVVKDLSRLGRHRTQTALYIDYLREKNIRVLSVTEELDTFRDEDDLVVGVRGLMNDYYAKDIGKKIRSGYRQKHLEGLVITPPFGYRKNRNTNTVEIHAEGAETVRLIFTLYLEGQGQKEIARQLNSLGRGTPSQLRSERCSGNAKTGNRPWTYTSVKNVLTEEAYTGVLINHKAEIKEGKKKELPPEVWIRHENWYPVIICREDWEKAQSLLQEKARQVFGNQPKHRYAGLICCSECGNAFVPQVRYWRDTRRVEYVCRGYHRNGKEYCSSHRIREEALDQAIQDCVQGRREELSEELRQLSEQKKVWALRKPVLDAHISALQEKIQSLEQEIDDIVMEKLNYKAEL